MKLLLIFNPDGAFPVGLLAKVAGCPVFTASNFAADRCSKTQRTCSRAASFLLYWVPKSFTPLTSACQAGQASANLRMSYPSGSAVPFPLVECANLWIEKVANARTTSAELVLLGPGPLLVWLPRTPSAGRHRREDRLYHQWKQLFG
jgi:hypothetical protein